MSYVARRPETITNLLGQRSVTLFLTPCVSVRESIDDELEEQ